MKLLPTITCPRCGQPCAVSPQTVYPRAAKDYESCLRKCAPCGFGFSNAFTGDAALLTVIYRNPFEFLPAHIADGHGRVLTNSLNETNRSSKAKRFTFGSSEDHLTWTVFRHLQLEGKLRLALTQLGLQIASASEPTLLLWGSAVPADDAPGAQVREKLLSVSNKLGEISTRRSEPDVVLDFGAAGVVLVEVKHRSPNEVKSADYPNWSRYVKATPAFRSEEAVKSAGLYELARNWRFAAELADGRPFAVVNLGPERLFNGDHRRRLEAFIAALNQSGSNRFLTATWPQFFAGVQPLPQWLTSYLSDRKVLR